MTRRPKPKPAPKPDPIRGYFTFRIFGANYSVEIPAPSWFVARDRAARQLGCLRGELEFLGMREPDAPIEGDGGGCGVSELPCRVCGERTLGQQTGVPGQNDPICRDCDLDELHDQMRCPECRQWCVRPNNGLIELERNGHAEGCSVFEEDGRR